MSNARPIPDPERIPRTHDQVLNNAVTTSRERKCRQQHIASVLGVLSWNAGNKLLGVTNGMLFINFVPVTVFAIRIAQGHHFQPIEFVGAALVIGALIANYVVVRRVPAQRRAKQRAQSWSRVFVVATRWRSTSAMRRRSRKRSAICRGSISS